MVEQSLLDRFAWPVPAIQDFFRGEPRQSAVRTTSSITFAYRPATQPINPRLLAEQDRQEIAKEEEESRRLASRPAGRDDGRRSQRPPHERRPTTHLTRRGRRWRPRAAAVARRWAAACDQRPAQPRQRADAHGWRALATSASTVRGGIDSRSTAAVRRRPPASTSAPSTRFPDGCRSRIGSACNADSDQFRRHRLASNGTTLPTWRRQHLHRHDHQRRRPQQPGRPEPEARSLVVDNSGNMRNVRLGGDGDWNDARPRPWPPN